MQKVTAAIAGMIFIISAPTQAAECTMKIRGKKINCFTPEARVALQEDKQVDLVIELKNASPLDVADLGRHLDTISK